MSRKEIEDLYKSILDDVAAGSIVFAIDKLKRLIRQSTRSDYFYELETVGENYSNLLKYAFKGKKDPMRNEILGSVSASILHLADDIADHLLEDSFPGQKQSQIMLNKEFGTDPSAISAKIEEIFFSHEVSGLIADDSAFPSPVTDSIFRLIWLIRRVKDYDEKMIRHLNQDEGVEWPEKCLTVSALTLSLLRFFNPLKFELLSEFIRKKEPQVYHRAVTGFILNLIKYDDRIRFYPELVRLVEELAADEDVRQDVETVILQLLLAGETEKISREFQEEVLPEMQRVMPKLTDKLQLDNVVEEEDPEGENPGWKEMFDEVPGLFEKIEKFSRMQMEGADVFMSTFAMLKRFDFFDQMRNWFIPYSHSHPVLQSGGVEEPGIRNRLLEGLEKAFYICNSDKYSFALNFNSIPAPQRSIIVTHFEVELEQMKELASEEAILDPAMIYNSIFTQYIQDLYRFCKLYPLKGEFEDFFRWRLDYPELRYLKKFSDPHIFTERIAAFYFSKDHWDEAIDLYKYLEKEGRTTSQLYQKLGYALQKKGSWKEAREAYIKAELFDVDRLWVLKKLIWCSIKLQDYRQALSYAGDALALQPDNLNLHSQAGQCFFNLHDYREAIRHYNQVRFFSPGNLKALRPIGYCHFILGELEEAAGAYREILESAGDPLPYDLMNAGHVMLCLGEREKALGFYRSTLKTEGFTSELFAKTFEEDIPYLINYGISEEDIPLIIDFIISPG